MTHAWLSVYHCKQHIRIEYFKIVDIVTGIDERLLTIKGWGVSRGGSFLHRLRSHPFAYPHVLFTHLVSFTVGTALFIVGLSGQFAVLASDWHDQPSAADGDRRECGRQPEQKPDEARDEGELAEVSSVA